VGCRKWLHEDVSTLITLASHKEGLMYDLSNHLISLHVIKILCETRGFPLIFLITTTNKEKKFKIIFFNAFRWVFKIEETINGSKTEQRGMQTSLWVFMGFWCKL
jgi:hypothetical protein